MAKGNVPKPKQRKNPNPKLTPTAQKRRQSIDNARQRYERQAQRYERMSETLEGKDRDAYRHAAMELRQRSSDLKGINARKRLAPEKKALIDDSKNFLQSSNTTEWQRGETLGKLRLSGTNLGHRFYALTSTLWEGVGYSGKVGDDRRINAIRRALVKDANIRKKYGSRPNVNEMIEIIEEMTGVNLESYTSDYEPEKYTSHFIRGMNIILQRHG